MIPNRLFIVLLWQVLLAAGLHADDGDTWTRTLKSRAERGSLEARAENVRGDTGRWRDEALLQIAPSLAEKPGKLPLDDWADQLLDAKVNPNSGSDTFLIFRTRQFDDNDRAWVEKIERHGNRFTVVMHQAIWKGYYSKSFTYYRVLAVNLGRLPAGNYEATWTIQPLTFTAFEDPTNRQNSASKDEKPAEAPKREKLKHDLAFRVVDR
jgi:hypothetical protein